MKKKTLPEDIFIPTGETPKTYKDLYEKEVEQRTKLAEDYSKLSVDYAELVTDVEYLHRKIEKYETIIHTVEAFVGQKIIEV